MERLTARTTDGVLYSRRGYEMVLARLENYEDTGLTPEEIKGLINTNENLVKQNDKQYLQFKEYRQAEKQGLLHRTPIPDGTPIFIINDEDEEFIGDAFEPILETSYLCNHTEFTYGEMYKDWFITREAAEEALKGGEGE